MLELCQGGRVGAAWGLGKLKLSLSQNHEQTKAVNFSFKG